MFLLQPSLASPSQNGTKVTHVGANAILPELLSAIWSTYRQAALLRDRNLRFRPRGALETGM